jgi:hypothetical protein
MPAAALAKEPLPPKFRISGPTLIFDTETGMEGGDAEITNSDIANLRRLLEATPGLTELQLNSSGGSVYAGQEIAWIVIDYELDTVVSGECVSACVDVFLAGSRRRMELGSKISFHQRHWSPGAVKRYYDKWRVEEEWETPFDFGSWIYADTQTEVYEHLTYMVERGVDAGFAIKTLRVGAGTEWYPNRRQLTAAGILRAAPERK